jgi:hypothetical protein
MNRRSGMGTAYCNGRRRMSVDEIIALVSGWIDNVETSGAAARIAEAQAAFRSKALRATVVEVGDFELMRTCIHEGAHVVAAHYSGLSITGACVRGGSGCAEYGSDERSPDMLAMAAADLAGITAEFLLLGVDAAREHQLAHSHDLLRARLRIDTLRPLGWSLPTRTFVTMSTCLVRSRWDAIIRVAKTLSVLQELDGAVVAALCASAGSAQ